MREHVQHLRLVSGGAAVRLFYLGRTIKQVTGLRSILLNDFEVKVVVLVGFGRFVDIGILRILLYVQGPFVGANVIGLGTFLNLVI